MLRPTQTREVEKCSRYYVNKAKDKHKMASGRHEHISKTKTKFTEMEFLTWAIREYMKEQLIIYKRASSF